jgi:hypothetical protein
MKINKTLLAILLQQCSILWQPVGFIFLVAGALRRIIFEFP